MNSTYGTTPAGVYPADPPSAVTRGRRRFRWGLGITLAGFLAGGGIALALVSGGSAPGAAASTQGAVLNSALSAAAAPGQAAVPAKRVRWALGRLRRLGGVHGEFTVRYQDGYRTISFERGTVQSVSGGDVVVKAPDGTTWTWKVVSDTVVRKNGAKTTASALSAGETVFAGGPVTGGARDARLIVIRPARPAAPSGSGSAQTSLS